ncbi:hypothetical protein GCM10009584_27610 [Ornithinimicrobium humiphilum]|uniref:Uncharacterized protein n=1 Tax=Ornithinimicrobium humiphilum TaxID=125288 RepID=A0A543KP29_9MICO|nr:hypothetical protein [Ornithinimicrobium humiphilum]TQM96820.1 hypothetical protein FB476_1712 [Ornithinimicrobium humiphilum]
MRPTPGDVAAQITAIVGSTWPDGLDDGIPWLGSLGVSTETAEETSCEEDSGAWDFATLPAWGAAKVGWSTYRGRFAGVSWWLWSDLEWEDVRSAAAALAEEISTVHGAPSESTAEAEGRGPSWLWRLEGHDIEMYAHNGAIRPEGFAAGPSVVQLHVDLRPVAELREDEAQRRAVWKPQA